MADKIKVGIVGGAGYTGGELIRILLNHSGATIDFVQSSSNTGKPLHAVHGDLVGETDIVFAAKISQDVDVLFLCVGHGDAKKFLAANHIDQKIKLVDLSQDFRLLNSEHPGGRNFVRFKPDKVGRVERHPPAHRLIYTGEQIENGGLACPIRSDQPVQRAARNANRETLYRLETAKRNTDVVDN